jgi:hypothetical protein
LIGLNSPKKIFVLAKLIINVTFYANLDVYKKFVNKNQVIKVSMHVECINAVQNVKFLTNVAKNVDYSMATLYHKFMTVQATIYVNRNVITVIINVVLKFLKLIKSIYAKIKTSA